MSKKTEEKILKAIENKRVMFWGASKFLENFLKEVNLESYNILGIIDSNTDRQNTKLGGYTIYPKTVLDKLKPEAILLTVLNGNENIWWHVNNFLKQNHPEIKMLDNIFDEENEKRSNSYMFSELIQAQVFNNIINNTGWLKKKDFIPINGAANYSLLTILYIALEYFNPHNILEMGMGQTSKLTSQYAKYKNKKSSLIILEDNPEWLKFFQNQVCKGSNIKTALIPTEDFVYNSTVSKKYSNLDGVIENRKFDLIVADGPCGNNQQYPRTNVLDLIPNNLADDFIIILDDAEREGEMNTAYLILEALDKHNIKYLKKYRHANKSQFIVVSESNKIFMNY